MCDVPRQRENIFHSWHKSGNSLHIIVTPLTDVPRNHCTYAPLRIGIQDANSTGMNPTKKYMLENFKELYRHSDLLELYLYDTQTGRKPDASERFHDERTNVRMQLYRATSAHGGYVVILNGNTNIHYLDDINAKMRDVCSQYALGMKICLERLTVARNRMLTAEANDTQPAFD